MRTQYKLNIEWRKKKAINTPPQRNKKPLRKNNAKFETAQRTTPKGYTRGNKTYSSVPQPRPKKEKKVQPLPHYSSSFSPVKILLLSDAVGRRQTGDWPNTAYLRIWLFFIVSWHFSLVENGKNALSEIHFYLKQFSKRHTSVLATKLYTKSLRKKGTHHPSAPNTGHGCWSPMRTRTCFDFWFFWIFQKFQISNIYYQKLRIFQKKNIFSTQTNFAKTPTKQKKITAAPLFQW